MKIAFAIRDRKNFIGGPAANAVRLLLALRERGHDVHVLGFWVGQEKSHAHLDMLEAAGIPCRIIKRQPYTEDGVRWILEQLRDIRPDVFVADLSTEGCFAAHWLMQAGIPVVNTVYGTDEVNLGRAVYFSDCSSDWRVSGHVVYGESLLARMRKLIKNYLPTTVIAGIADIPERHAHVPQPQAMNIVYAGRLVEDQKRVGEMIAAFIRLCKSQARFQFHLIGDSIGNERVQYEQMVRESGFQKRITFHGILRGQEYFNELSKHQVIILLSDYEGIPGSVIDGMATGLVPVCLHYPGVDDLISNGENGLVVTDREASLESALVSLSTDAMLWQRLSTNARAYSKAHFDKSLVVDKWEQFLQEHTRKVSVHGEIEIPARIGLPRKSKLLPEDRRRPGILHKIKKKFSFSVHSSTISISNIPI